MKPPLTRVITITQKASASNLSKAQKLFNRLIKKIDAQRQQLRAWQTSIPLYQRQHATAYQPLIASYDEHRARLVHLFDRLYPDKSFSQADREKLAHLIRQIAGELLLEREDLELKAIFNQYSEVDFDTQSDASRAEVKAMLEKMFGSKIEGEIDPGDAEAMRKLMAEKAQEMHEREAAARQASAGKRKKTTKQLAKEARLEQEEKSISQSIREVFRKLASALHPDREPDSAERARKTKLMQRVNVAYGNKDLLQLLELQLEVEQIDQTMIDTIGEERLQHYNQVLADQSRELELEVGQTEIAFRAHFQINPDRPLTPASLVSILEREITRLHRDIHDLARDLQVLEQPKKLKAWLKNYRAGPSYADDGFEF